MAKFPYRDSDSKALEKGEGVARARYYRDLQSSAKEILDEHVEHGTEVDDLIHQDADRAVIYTKHALDILVESNNYTAIDDVGEIPQNASEAITSMAYWAYRQDLSEEVYEQAEKREIEVNPGLIRRRKKRN